MGRREVLLDVRAVLEDIINNSGKDSAALQKSIHAVSDTLARAVPNLLIRAAWNSYALLLDLPFAGQEEFSYLEAEIGKAETALGKLSKKETKMKSIRKERVRVIAAIYRVRTLALKQLVYEKAMLPYRNEFLRTGNPTGISDAVASHIPRDPTLQGMIIAAAQRVIENASELPAYYALELQQWRNAYDKSQHR